MLKNSNNFNSVEAFGKTATKRFSPCKSCTCKCASKFNTNSTAEFNARTARQMNQR